MPIRALLMDIDDTLFDFQTSSRNALSIAFRAFGLPFTPEMWERYRALDAELWQRFERGEITKEALYVKRFRVFFAEYGLEADPAAFNAAYFRELGDQCNFMPDFKYSDAALAKKLSAAPDYPQIASAAILEMYQQVGGAVIEDEQMTRGVIIRHLVLPGCIDNSLGVLDWIADNFPKKDVLVSLMSQYVPMGRAKKLPPFDRRITQEEYDAVLSYLYLLELDNGYTQDFSAASAEYIPEFDLEGL